MPVYLLTLKDSAKSAVRFANVLLLNAKDANAAKSRAQTIFRGDADAAWDSAVVEEQTEILTNVVDALPQWKCRIQINTNPVIDFTVGNVGGSQVAASMISINQINNGGTGYVVGDIIQTNQVSPSGTREGSFRVTSVNAGVIDGIVIVDPMDWPNNPQPIEAFPLTGGTGTGASIWTDMSRFAWNTLWAQMVTSLLAQSAISNAAVDVSASPPKLTIAGAADNLGDRTVTLTMIPPEGANYGLGSLNSTFFGTLTHEGNVGDALELDLVDPSTFPVPKPITSFFV